MKRILIIIALLLSLSPAIHAQSDWGYSPLGSGSSTSGISWLANPSTGTPFSISWPGVDTSRGFKIYRNANVLAIDTVPAGSVMWTLQNIATTGEAVLKIHNNNNQGLEIKQNGSLVATTALRSASMLQFNATTAFYMSSNLKPQIWTTFKAGTFVDAAKEKMRLDADGNLGIGKYNIQLQSKLEVTGGVRADTIIAPLRVTDTTNIVRGDSAVYLVQERFIGPFIQSSDANSSGRMGYMTFDIYQGMATEADEMLFGVVSDTANGVYVLRIEAAQATTSQYNATYGRRIGDEEVELWYMSATDVPASRTVSNAPNVNPLTLAPNTSWSLNNVLFYCTNQNSSSRKVQLKVSFWIDNANTSTYYVKLTDI